MKRSSFMVMSAGALFLLHCGGEKSDGANRGGAGSGAHSGLAGQSGNAEGGGDALDSARGGSSSGAAAGSPTSGGAGTGGMASSGGSAGSAPVDSSCTADLAGLEVDPGGTRDPLGYPPYALDGCQLAYLANDDEAGALRLRNLATGEDELLEPASARPRRPSLSGDLVAWEIDDAGTSQVRVRYLGDTVTLSGPFHHGAEPRAAAGCVVFSAFLAAGATSDTDIFLYEPSLEKLTPVITGSGQQRFADASPTQIVASDFSEGPLGHFEDSAALADLVLVDRESGLVSRRERPGKQAFPLFGRDGSLVYLEWSEVHPEPKFSKFWINVGRLDMPASLDAPLLNRAVQTDRPYLRPSVRGDRVDFLDTVDGKLALYSARLDGAEAPTSRANLPSTALYGPIAADALTLTSEQLPNGHLRLVPLQR